MSRFQTVAQAVNRRIRQCDRHRAAHLALAAVHAVIGVILAAGAAMPEAACAWIAALIYAFLAKSGGNHA
jgi:hypothetical protein